MKYIYKEDYDNNNFDNLIYAENINELEEKIGNVKGYGIDMCPNDKADGIILVQK